MTDDVIAILRGSFGILVKEDETGLLVVQFDGDPSVVDTSRSASALFEEIACSPALKVRRFIYQMPEARQAA